MLFRLKQLDEANGHTAVVNGDDHTDNGLVGDRTGHVHAAAKQDIVRQWLQGSLDNVSPSGQMCISLPLDFTECALLCLSLFIWACH